MTSPGIAFIGGGLFIKQFHLPALLKNEANIVAAYSRSTKSATSVVEETEKLGAKEAASKISVYSDEKSGEGLDQLLERSDVKGVIVALPILIQPDVVRKCFAAGKHVLCEKPLAKDFEEAKRLVDDYNASYAAKGIVFSIAEQLRYDRASKKAREIVQSGKIGELRGIHGRMWSDIKPDGSNQWFETEWRKNATFQGGFILDAGVHFVAAMRYISGAEIVETASFANQFKSYLVPLDTVNAASKWSNGAMGTLSISFASSKSSQDFIYSGIKGSLSIVLEGFGTYHLTVEDTEGNVVQKESIDGEAVFEENKAFLKAIKDGKNEKEASAEEAVADLAVIESLVSGGGKVKSL